MPSKGVVSMIWNLYRHYFPLHGGGPMGAADQQGPHNVVQAMKQLASSPREDASLWQPASLLANAVGNGALFSCIEKLALDTQHNSRRIRR